MTVWHLVFQRDGSPISVIRADGVRETPPPGLIRYVELARGAWTTEPPVAPAGIESVDWPRPCVWATVTGCSGAMSYVEHVAQPVVMAETGETIYPSGWQCNVCSCEEVGGFSVLSTEWTEPDEDKPE
jgi:hypothetical protein